MAWGSYRAKAESAASSRYFATWSVRRKLLCSLIRQCCWCLWWPVCHQLVFLALFEPGAAAHGPGAKPCAGARDGAAAGVLSPRRSGAGQGGAGPGRLYDAFARCDVYHANVLKELSFVASNASGSVVLVRTASGVREVRPDQYNAIKGSPVTHAVRLQGREPGVVELSRLSEWRTLPRPFSTRPAPRPLCSTADNPGA